MEKKKCELCCGVARIYCESDQASLCWNCDGDVHGANFLVAKHTRCLLCSACQSHTSWKASGLRLSPTVSICESCVARKNNNSGSGRESTNRNLNQLINGHGFDGDQLREDDGAESYNDDEGEDEDEEKEEAENQVVPLDPAAAAQQPPVVSSLSSVSSGDDGALVAKRTRRCIDLNCSDEESNDSRPLKRLSKDETSSRSTAMMNSTLRFTACDTSSSSSTLVLEIANKSRDLTVDYLLT